MGPCGPHIGLEGARSRPRPRPRVARSRPRPGPRVARSGPRPGPGVNLTRKIYWLGHDP